MEDTNNKNMWMWVTGIVVLAAVASLLVWSMNSSTPVLAPSTNNNPVVDNTALDANLGTEDISAGSVNTGSTAVSISYANALIKYKDARLQLDKTCQASPDKMTFKNNTNIMIDNRAPVARSVRVGSIFPIKAYGFKIVNLSSATLPATWLVDCDKSQNVSTILIQK